MRLDEPEMDRTFTKYLRKDARFNSKRVTIVFAAFGILSLFGGLGVTDWSADDVFEGNAGRSLLSMFVIMACGTVASTLCILLSRKYHIVRELIGISFQVGVAIAFLLINGLEVVG